jgi:hypothetical protein
MSAFSKTPTAAPRAPVRGLWTHLDEQLLRDGTFRHAKPPHDPVHAMATCTTCAIARSAERRRMSVKRFLQTVEIQFGGTKPIEPEPER